MLKELKTHHREIGRLRVEGFKPDEIAQRLEMKIQTVYNILRDPLCKGFMDGLADKADACTVNVRKQLAGLNQYAVKGLKDLLTLGDTPAATMLGACKDVLDRNGFKAPEKVEHIHAHLTAEDIAQLKARREQVSQSLNYVDV